MRVGELLFWGSFAQKYEPFGESDTFCQIVQRHLIFMAMDIMEQQSDVRLICYKEENRWALAYRQIMNIR